VTRRDYVILAAACRASRPAEYFHERARQSTDATVAWLACVYSISNACLKDNPTRFDSQRFIEASGVFDE